MSKKVYFSQEVDNLIKENGLPLQNSRIYLLCRYLGVDKIPWILEKNRRKIDSLGIFIEEEGTAVKWNMEPVIFDDDDFAWVYDYMELFSKRNDRRTGDYVEVKERMKEFMRENPDVSKEEVMEATKLYLTDRNYKYVSASFYFIYDKKKESKLRKYISKIRKMVGNDKSPSNR